MSMVTATTWVLQGFAARYPIKYDFNEDEYNRIAKLARLQLDDAKEDLAGAQKEQGDDGKGELGAGVKVPAAFKRKSKESGLCTSSILRIANRGFGAVKTMTISENTTWSIMMTMLTVSWVEQETL